MEVNVQHGGDKAGQSLWDLSCSLAGGGAYSPLCFPVRCS